MTQITTPRFVTDDEIRATYERDRSIREACSAIRFYGEKLDEARLVDESYFVPISASFRPTLSATLDHLRVHASALALTYEAKSAADRVTYHVATQELNRILDYNDERMNFSQKKFASAIRNNPNGITKMLHEVTQDKGVKHFWQEHAAAQKSGELSSNCKFELEERVHEHFAKKHSIQDLFTKDLGAQR